MREITNIGDWAAIEDTRPRASELISKISQVFIIINLIQCISDIVWGESNHVDIAYVLTAVPLGWVSIDLLFML